MAHTKKPIPGSRGTTNPCALTGVTDVRVLESFQVRCDASKAEAEIAVPPHTTNGDEGRYPDLCATYTKGILQDAPCRVNLPAYKLFHDALKSGLPADFEKIPLGSSSVTLNGPQGAYAFTLAGTDSSQFGDAPMLTNQETAHVVPAPPALASEAYGTELTELYWCSLLRDVAFESFETNPVAATAAAELSTMPAYVGPKDDGMVTPRLLFRGGYAGEAIGPYLSQFLLLPTKLGAQALDQRLVTYMPGIDYMTDLTTWEAVQNGIDTGLRNQVDPVLRYLRDGRGLAAYTHVDELFQAYFTAYLVLRSLGIGKNPDSPYAASKTQNGFGTFGPPDVASTLATIAKIALNAVWYQKWLVHLRHRPESGGGIVELIKTGMGGAIDGSVHANVLASMALQESFKRWGSHLLSQPFPEGSPTHPAYPTGHGTVGGACITVLKFFFDGSAVIPNPQVPSDDGLSLSPYIYTGADKGLMRVEGELNKLAHNVTFGHGLHGGIHWRSDSDDSMLLGEAVAIGALQDLARTYNERFEVRFRKLDGSTATISH